MLDGDPIPNDYPAILPLNMFHEAQACLGSRKIGNVGRESKLFNVFSGSLRDARNGKSYITHLRIERGDKRHHVLQAAATHVCAASFPYAVFEEAILQCLLEVDPRELLPTNGDANEVLGLEGEFAAVNRELVAIAEEMDVEYSDTLAGVLRRKEAKKRDVAERLAKAKQRAASPASEAWGQAKPLLETLATAADPAAAKLR